MRDLECQLARSAAGAQCLVEFREEMLARAEVDCWDIESPIGKTIDRHVGRLTSRILQRSEE